MKPFPFSSVQDISRFLSCGEDSSGTSDCMGKALEFRRPRLLELLTLLGEGDVGQGEADPGKDFKDFGEASKLSW